MIERMKELRRRRKRKAEGKGLARMPASPRPPNPRRIAETGRPRPSPRDYRPSQSPHEPAPRRPRSAPHRLPPGG